MTNLINIMTEKYAQPSSVIPKSNLTIDFSTDNKITPFEAKGKMLPSRIFGSPVEYAKDIKKDIVSISKGAKGKANDHELGRINDLAMKTGGLALAAYLFVKNPLKLSKTMEFVGFGTFFASMALWPKLFIQAPLKAKTGVDIHRKYEDSYGRKKSFFQDPQYIPWDLVSKDELNQLGDKMKISKDTPNREEAIQQKAQKIAVQGNTLWMLTAGFATPLMSALSCSAFEKILQKGQVEAGLHKTSKALEKLTTDSVTEVTDLAAYRMKDSSVQKAFTKFFAQNKGQKVDEGALTQLAQTIVPDDMMMQKSVMQQLQRYVAPVPTTIGFDFNEAVHNQLKVIIKKYGIDSNNLETLLNSKGPGYVLTPENLTQLADEISGLATKPLSKGGKQILQTNIRKTLTEKISATSAPAVETLEEPASKLMKLLDNFRAQKSVVTDYKNTRIGENAGSYIAQQWNKVCDTYLNVLGIKGKDIKAAKDGGTNLTDLISQRLEQLAQQPDKYQEAMKKMSAEIDKFNQTVAKQGGGSFIEAAQQGIEKVADNNAGAFRRFGFEDMAEALSTDKAGAFKQVQKADIQGATLGASSSFYRMMQSMDLFSRLEDPNFIRQLNLFDKFKVLNDDGMSNWLLKNVGEYLNGTQTTEQIQTLFANEFGGSKAGRYSQQLQDELMSYVQELKANPNAGTTITEPVNKLISKFKHIVLDYKITDQTEQLYDVGSSEYKFVMKTMFGEDSLGKATKNAIEEYAEKAQSSTVMSGLARYKEMFTEKIGNYKYWFKPKHTVAEEGSDVIQNTVKHKLVGKPINETIRDFADTAFNSKKWLKTFGIAAIALVGATLIIQQFFGKDKKDKAQIKEQQA